MFEKSGTTYQEFNEINQTYQVNDGQKHKERQTAGFKVELKNRTDQLG